MSRKIESFNKKISKKYSIKLDVDKVSTYNQNKFRYKKVKNTIQELGVLLDFDSSYDQTINCNMIILNSSPVRIDCDIRYKRSGVFNFSILFLDDEVKIKSEANNNGIKSLGLNSENKVGQYLSIDEFKEYYYSFEYNYYSTIINDFENTFCSREEYINTDRSLYIPLIQAYLI